MADASCHRVLAKDALHHFNLRKVEDLNLQREHEERDHVVDKELNDLMRLVETIHRSEATEANASLMYTNVDAGCSVLSSLLFATSSASLHCDPKFLNYISERHGKQKVQARRAQVTITTAVTRAFSSCTNVQRLLDVHTADRVIAGWIYFPAWTDPAIAGFARRTHDVQAGIETVSYAQYARVHAVYEPESKRNSDIMSAICKDWRQRGMPAQHGPEYVHSWCSDTHRPEWVRQARSILGMSDARDSSSVEALMIAVECSDVGLLPCFSKDPDAAVLFCDVDVLCQVPTFRTTLAELFTTRGASSVDVLNREEVSRRCFLGRRARCGGCTKDMCGTRCTCKEIYAFKQYVRALPWGSAVARRSVSRTVDGELQLAEHTFSDGKSRIVTKLTQCARADLFTLAMLCVVAGAEGRAIAASAVEKVPGVVRLLIRMELRTVALDVALRFASALSSLQTGIIAATGVCRHPGLLTTRKPMIAAQSYMKEEFSGWLMELGLGVGVASLMNLRATLGLNTLPCSTQIVPYLFGTPRSIMPLVSDPRIDCALRNGIWQAYCEASNSRHTVRIVPYHPDVHDESFRAAYKYFTDACALRDTAWNEMANYVDYMSSSSVTRSHFLSNSHPEYAHEIFAIYRQGHESVLRQREASTENKGAKQLATSAYTEGGLDVRYFVPSNGPLFGSDVFFTSRYKRRDRMLIADAIFNVRGTMTEVTNTPQDMSQSRVRCSYNIFSLSPMRSLWQNSCAQACADKATYMRVRNLATRVLSSTVDEFTYNSKWACDQTDDIAEGEKVLFTPFDVLNDLQLSGVVAHGACVWKSVYVAEVARRCLEPCAHVDVLCCFRTPREMHTQIRTIVCKIIEMSPDRPVAVLHGRMNASIVIVSPMMSCAMAVRFARCVYSTSGDVSCLEDYGISNPLHVDCETSLHGERDGHTKSAIRAALSCSSVQYEQVVYVPSREYSTVHATPSALQALRSGVTHISYHDFDVEYNRKQVCPHSVLSVSKRIQDGFMVSVCQDHEGQSRSASITTSSSQHNTPNMIDDIFLSDTNAETSSALRFKAALSTNISLRSCVRLSKKYLSQMDILTASEPMDFADRIAEAKRYLGSLSSRPVTLLWKSELCTTEMSTKSLCVEWAVLMDTLAAIRVIDSSGMMSHKSHPSTYLTHLPPYGGTETAVGDFDLHSCYACIVECPTVDKVVSAHVKQTKIILYEPATCTRMGYVGELDLPKPIAIVPEFGRAVLDVFSPSPEFGIAYTGSPWAFVARGRIDGTPNRDVVFCGAECTHISIRIEHLLCVGEDGGHGWCADAKALDALRDLVEATGVDIHPAVADEMLWKALRSTTGSKEEQVYMQKLIDRVGADEMLPLCALPKMASYLRGVTHAEYLNLLDAKRAACLFSVDAGAHMDATLEFDSVLLDRQISESSKKTHFTPSAPIQLKLLNTQNLGLSQGHFILHCITFRPTVLSAGNGYAPKVASGDEVVAMISFAGVIFGHPADVVAEATKLGLFPTIALTKNREEGTYRHEDSSNASMCLFTLWEIRAIQRIVTVK